MTLSERNAFFKIGIIFCALCTALVVWASFSIIHVYPQIDQSLSRPASFFQRIFGFFLASNFNAVHASIALSVLFSFVGIILIHKFFERTSAPEILYIAFFTISFAFEVFRFIFPLQLMFSFPPFYVSVTLRILIFARFFCIFSIFSASLCAAGLEVQKTRNVIFLIVLAAIVITIGIPIDTLNWDTSLNMVNGYSSTFRLIELVALLITVASFLVAAKNRETKEYNYIAIGIVIALAGRNMLINSDNWAGPAIGILLLSFGICFLCTKLHKIHLWL